MKLLFAEESESVGVDEGGLRVRAPVNPPWVIIRAVLRQ
jgi:hypothetical protein